MTDAAPKTPEEINKLLAETRKLDAETARVDQDRADAERGARLAEAERQAAINKLDAERRAIEVAIAAGEHDVAIKALIRAREERQEREELAESRYHHSYRFATSINATSVALCLDRLNEWHRIDPQCPIEVVFTSPGGEVIPGLELFDYLRMLSREGHHVTTGTMGYAASMAGILLQAGDTRWMSKESWLLIHEVSFGASGKMGEIEDTTDWLRRMEDRIIAIFADRSGGHLSKAKLKAGWKRKDWWLDSDQAHGYGLVDEIR